MRGLRDKTKQLQSEKEEMEKRLTNEIIEKDLRADKLNLEMQRCKEQLSTIQAQVFLNIGWWKDKGKGRRYQINAGYVQHGKGRTE